jgi:REP element-mobilizing transposase RayT
MTHHLPFHRRTIRVPTWDYTSHAAYFVTVCAHKRRLLFQSPAVQSVIVAAWNDLPNHHPGVALDAFVVMPNHVHFVFFLERDSVEQRSRAQQAAPLRRRRHAIGVDPGALGAIVRSFKARVTRDLRAGGWSSDNAVWQRNYYEHIVRNDGDLERVRKYIADNPARWHADRDNPAGSPDDEERTFWLLLSNRANS